MNQRMEAVPTHDPKLEMLVLGLMLYHPDLAKHATEQLEGGLFYLPGHKLAFDILTCQCARNGCCDELCLNDTLVQRGWSGDDAQPFSQSLGVAGMTAQSGSWFSYIEKLEALKAERTSLHAAGAILNGSKNVGEVARELAELATQRGAIEESSVEVLAGEIEDEIAGKRRAVRFPNWPHMSSTQALLPGTLTILCGSPGVSKSFFSIEPLWRWAEGGEQAAALELESGANYHLRRIHAQMSGNAMITRAEWCRQNAEKVRNLLAEYRDRLDALRPVVQAPLPTDRPTKDYLINWIRARCIDGCRVLIIDPITMMQTSDKGFRDHEQFVSEAKAIIKRYGASLILVTHPKRGMPGNPILPCLENLPNSSAYERFSDSIFWLESVEEGVEEFEDRTGIKRDLKVNRYLHCLKVRLAKNPGRLAFFFDPSSLRHIECGVL